MYISIVELVSVTNSLSRVCNGSSTSFAVPGVVWRRNRRTPPRLRPTSALSSTDGLPTPDLGSPDGPWRRHHSSGVDVRRWSVPVDRRHRFTASAIVLLRQFNNIYGCWHVMCYVVLTKWRKSHLFVCVDFDVERYPKLYMQLYSPHGQLVWETVKTQNNLNTIRMHTGRHTHMTTKCKKYWYKLHFVIASFHLHKTQ